jgi:L-threonylcarbamoyladenylate synthase
VTELSSVGEAVEALRAGRLAVVPTDTVYGLAATPYRVAPALELYRLKGRPATQPTALLAPDLDMLFECVPELRGRSGTIARALLPGPYTLVLPNPAKRFAWLCGETPEAIGVRVPDLAAGPGRDVLVRAGALVATSANLAGGPEPRRLADVPEAIRAACVLVDGGELPGTSSTVLDFTGAEPRVLREGAAPAAEALARVAAALA